MKRKIEFNLTKGKVFQKPPTEVIYQRLIAQNKIKRGDKFRASYDCKDGKVIIEIDDIQTNPTELSTEVRNFVKDESRFKI